ncbi:MAG: hypothetical protein JNL98_25930 [Bryobacterales bacterium]|nr:hypothetical protein [Bryobacterales bacterium]
MPRRFLIALVLAGISGLPAACQTEVEVRKTPIGVQYRITDGGVEAVLTAGGKRASYRAKVSPNATPARQFQLLGKLFARVQQEGPLPAAFSFAMGGYEEPVEHLARTAACSSDWDGARGRPVKGTANAYLLKQLSNEAAFRSLSEFFRGMGYRSRAVSVEQILLETCSKPQCDARCAGAGKQRVPASAAISYEIFK